MISLAYRLPGGGQFPVLGRNYFLLRPTSAKALPCPSPFLYLEISVGLLFFYVLFFTTDTTGAIQDAFWRVLAPTLRPPLLQPPQLGSDLPIHLPWYQGGVYRNPCPVWVSPRAAASWQRLDPSTFFGEGAVEPADSRAGAEASTSQPWPLSKAGPHPDPPPATSCSPTTAHTTEPRPG